MFTKRNVVIIYAQFLTKSATEGAQAESNEVNLSRFSVGGEVYGDF